MEQNVKLTISDGVSAAIQETAKAIQAGFAFASTSEGQLTCEAWRTNTATWNAAILKAGAWIQGLFEGVK